MCLCHASVHMPCICFINNTFSNFFVRFCWIYQGKHRMFTCPECYKPSHEHLLPQYWKNNVNICLNRLRFILVHLSNWIVKLDHLNYFSGKSTKNQPTSPNVHHLNNKQKPETHTRTKPVRKAGNEGAVYQPSFGVSNERRRGSDKNVHRGSTGSSKPSTRTKWVKAIACTNEDIYMYVKSKSQGITLLGFCGNFTDISEFMEFSFYMYVKGKIQEIILLRFCVNFEDISECL